MNKRILAFLVAGITLSSTVVFAAKYTVNTSGTVKTQTGQVITSPANRLIRIFITIILLQTI